MRAGAACAPEQQRAGRNRRWCIPSAILRSPGESLDGVPVLHELDGELGLLLWYTVRDVTLWASTPASERHKLFGLCSTVRLSAFAVHVPEVLRPSLESITALLMEPGTTNAESLSISCLEISDWARRNRARSTALAFAQAGALVAPEMADPALQTAICAREAGEAARAETWARRATSVARRERNWAVHAAGWVLLGNIYRDVGNEVRASEFLMLGLRISRRASVPMARRDAAYGLFRLALARGDKETAASMAKIAQTHCTRDNAGSSTILVDLARFWTDQGQAGRVRNALRRLRLHLAELTHTDALAAAALMARMLAENGHPRLSRRAELRTWGLLVSDSTPDEAAYRAALDLAHGAALRRELDSFHRAERAALRLAPGPGYDWTRRTLAELARNTWGVS